jgi:hypothetical protein
MTTASRDIVLCTLLAFVLGTAAIVYFNLEYLQTACRQ